MSSGSVTRQQGRVARQSLGAVKTVVQRGRPLVSAVAHPAQLRGPRARTPIRPGGTTDQRGVMASDAAWIGIDVSKAELVVAIEPSGERWTSGTEPAAVGRLVERLRGAHPQLIVVEATGGYEAGVVAACAAAALPIAVVNPRQVRAFAQALGRTAKTDAIDAHVLARFAARVQPPVRPLPNADTQALADLVARRRQLLEMLLAERQRL